MDEAIHCPYCNQQAVLKTGQDVYPQWPRLKTRHYWVCSPCDARVGTHKGTRRPFGTMANAELRRWRQQAHAAFDASWRKKHGRSKAYQILASRLEISQKQCHIGLFDISTCQRVLNLYD